MDMKTKVYNAVAIAAGTAILWFGGWMGMLMVNGIVKLLHI